MDKNLSTYQIQGWDCIVIQDVNRNYSLTIKITSTSNSKLTCTMCEIINLKTLAECRDLAKLCIGFAEISSYEAIALVNKIGQSATISELEDFIDIGII